MNIEVKDYCQHINLEILQKVKKIPQKKIQCEATHSEQDNEPSQQWICLNCGFVGCSRYSVNQCMQKHENETDHCLCYNFDQNMLWCNKCDENLFDFLSFKIDEENTTKYKNFERLLEIIQEQLKNIKPSKDIKFQRQLSLIEMPINLFGLRNLGNTCFFNSVMQPIFASELFLKFIARNKNSFDSDSLAMNILDLYQNRPDDQVKNPVKIFKKLIQKNKMYGYYNQQDANECFLFVLDIFELEMKKAKMHPSHPFLGYFVYKTKCLRCDKSEFFFERNCMLLLDLQKEIVHPEVKEVLYDEYEKLIYKIGSNYLRIDNQEISMHQNVIDSGFDKKKDVVYINININRQKHFSTMQQQLYDYFDFDIFSQKIHQFQCENCLEKTTCAYKKYFIYQTPLILVICIKRFKKSSYFYKKSSKKVQIEEFIDLTPFLIQRGSNKHFTAKYKLYAATHHSGSLGGGHYTSYVKRENQWYYISDSHYSKSSLSDCINSDPYMLFYELINQYNCKIVNYCCKLIQKL